MDFSVAIKDHVLEYFDDGHIYLVDGVIVPSITEILRTYFGNKYVKVSPEVLESARQRGITVHSEIEEYVKHGTEGKTREFQGFKFLEKNHGFEPIESEIPCILFEGNVPIAAGRIDLVLRWGGKLCGADIKSTSALDKDYLFYQLNLYRIAYEQSYGLEWKYLRAIHLKDDVRKFVDIPINPEMAWEIVKSWKEGEKHEQS